jgi:hypothetical protein
MMCSTHRAGTGSIHHETNEDDIQISWPSQDSELFLQQPLATEWSAIDEDIVYRLGAHEPFSLDYSIDITPPDQELSLFEQFFLSTDTELPVNTERLPQERQCSKCPRITDRSEFFTKRLRPRKHCNVCAEKSVQYLARRKQTKVSKPGKKVGGKQAKHGFDLDFTKLSPSAFREILELDQVPAGDTGVSDIRLDEHSPSAVYAPAFVSTDYVDSWSFAREQARNYSVSTSIAHSSAETLDALSPGDLDSLSAPPDEKHLWPDISEYYQDFEITSTFWEESSEVEAAYLRLPFVEREGTSNNDPTTRGSVPLQRPLPVDATICSEPSSSTLLPRDPFLNTLFAFIPSDLDILHSAPPLNTSTPNSTLKTSLTSYALSTRLLSLVSRWRTLNHPSHTTDHRADTFREISLLITLMTNSRIQPWPPLAQWLISMSSVVQALENNHCGAHPIRVFGKIKMMLNALETVAVREFGDAKGEVKKELGNANGEVKKGLSIDHVQIEQLLAHVERAQTRDLERHGALRWEDILTEDDVRSARFSKHWVVGGQPSRKDA